MINDLQKEIIEVLKDHLGDLLTEAKKEEIKAHINETILRMKASGLLPCDPYKVEIYNHQNMDKITPAMWQQMMEEDPLIRDKFNDPSFIHVVFFKGKEF